MTDRWLARWLPFVLERAGAAPVLEVGCGHGDDTAVLAQAGLRVIAFDLSRTAVAVASVRVPSASIACRDVREPLPVEDASTGVVLASLSLHYFPWAETLSIVAGIRRALRPGGVLLCRLNSTEDHHFGAGGDHPPIEPGYFLVDGQPKRFFDAPAARALFADGWNLLAMEHLVTRKYLQPKALWELVVERPAG